MYVEWSCGNDLFENTSPLVSGLFFFSNLSCETIIRYLNIKPILVHVYA
jgi:hypothetical protein